MATPVQADLQGVRVLVVDDTPVNRELLMVLLKSWGLRPAEASDGPRALQALAQASVAEDPFQIAVLDMHMPGMDGESLGRVIRMDPNLRDTRLIMCTSLGQFSSAQHWEEVGFVATLTKPVRRQELRESLEDAIGGHRTPFFRVNSEHAQGLGARFAHVRILLAEDNITNQQVALGILGQLGLRVEAVANGAEAIRSLETIPFDLVLMDVQMPVMDGLEATRQIRNPQSRVLNHQVPVVAMTAHALRGDRERCLEAGMNDYVAKPVEVSTLAAALERWLKPAGEVAVFNGAALARRLRSNKLLMRKVIEGFLGDMPGQILHLKTLVSTGDALSVVNQCHKIKGACATVGGEAMRALAEALEGAARSGDLTTVSGRLAELDAQFAGLQEQMRSDL